MSETWSRRVLLVAATWNILGGASALWNPSQHFAQMYTSALSLNQPVQLFFYRCTWINVIAWGIGYLIAAFRPGTRTAILTAGAAGKASYFLASLALYNAGAGTAMFLGSGAFDLLLAALFILVLLSPKQQRQTPGQ